MLDKSRNSKTYSSNSALPGCCSCASSYEETGVKIKLTILFNTLSFFIEVSTPYYKNVLDPLLLGDESLNSWKNFSKTRRRKNEL